MSVLAQLRRLLARRPWLYWAAVGALALMIGVLVAQATSRVEAAKESWGETRTVVAALVDIAPGDSLAGATGPRELPVPMVPNGAVTEIEPAATATQRLAAGEVVVMHDVAPMSGPRALIPDEWLAVAIAEPVGSGVRIGDQVSVASGGVVIAADGVVVGSVGESVLVAVPAAEAPQVAQAATSADIALLLKG